MPAPSVSWTVIPDGDIDPESPITTGLMTAIRDNAQYLYEWLGDGYTPAVDHNHDGVNSVLLPGNIFGQLYAWDSYR